MIATTPAATADTTASTDKQNADEMVKLVGELVGNVARLSAKFVGVSGKRTRKSLDTAAALLTATMDVDVRDVIERIVDTREAIRSHPAKGNPIRLGGEVWTAIQISNLALTPGASYRIFGVK